MKVEFRFNGNAQVILTPETEKEVTLTKLAFLSGRNKSAITFCASDNAVITVTLQEESYSECAGQH